MKTKLHTGTVERIHGALANAGLPWRHLTSTAEQIILFGSHAAGCASPQSDVDLICVGDGPRHLSRDLHLFWIPSEVLNDPDWTTTEIGAHVAKYGVWLKGVRQIGPPARAAEQAINKKANQIADRARMLATRWSELSPFFRKQQFLKLRRDIQRFDLLVEGEAVPPNSTLDQQWVRKRNRESWLGNVILRRPELSQLLRRLFTRTGGVD